MIDRLFGAIRERRNTSRTVQELSRLTDRELSDIGINRADIRRVARQRAA